MQASSPSTRRLGLALALGTLVLAVAGTQWPFEYRITEFALQRKWDRIDWSWFPRWRGGSIRLDHDIVVNLVMLVPLGIGFALWRRAAAWRIALEGLALGFATSATLEAAQLLTRSRYTQFADVWRNSLSCVLGCAIAIAVVRWRAARRV